MAVFNCPACDYEKSVPDSALGRRARCPVCGHVVSIVNVSAEEPVEIDLQTVDVDDSFAAEGTCDACGAVLDPEIGHGHCPECGRKICMTAPSVDEDVDESDLDLSDFVSNSERTWQDDSDDDVEDGLADDPHAPALRQGRVLQGGFINNVYAGIIAGLLGYLSALCMGLLVGSQVPDGLFLPFAGCMALISASVGAFLFSLRSRLTFALAGPESVLCGVLFLYVGSLYQSLIVAPPDSVMPTLTIAVMLATGLTGLTLYGLGRLGAGVWVRYTPVKVIGGTVGGIGFFVALAALSIISSASGMPQGVLPGLHMSNMIIDFSVSPLRWGPSVAFGILLLMLSPKLKGNGWLLVLVIGCIVAGLAAHVWLPGDARLAAVFAPFDMPIDPADFHSSVLKAGFWAQVQWQVILDHAYFIGGMMALAFIKVMYRGAMLEAQSGTSGGQGDFEAIGLANFGSALFGGMSVSFSRGRSIANLASGGGGALAGMVAAIICGGLYAAGELPVSVIPRFVPEGMLLFFGLGLIRDWLFRAHTAFSRRDDMFVMVVVFLCTILFGVVIGIGVGVACGLLMAIRRYSSEGGVRAEASGAFYRSNVDRAPAQSRLLREVGDHIHIVSLHGFVFLGTMQNLTERVQDRILDHERLDVEYLVVDFGGVTGFASFSNLGFGMLRNLALDEELNVIFTRVPLELEEFLEESGFAVNDMEGSFKIFVDMDYALEWCEDRLLEAENMASGTCGLLSEMLTPVFPDVRYVQALLKVMKRMEVDEGSILFRQGDPSDTMYFVETGSLVVEIERNGHKMRLKKVGPGGVVGEMGIYRDAPRSATVRTGEDCVLYMLTRKRLELVERKVPKLVSALNHFLINLTSDRLAEANRRNKDII